MVGVAGRGEDDVFGAVADLGLAAIRMPGGDQAQCADDGVSVVDGAGAELRPAEKPGDVGVGGVGGDLLRSVELAQAAADDNGEVAGQGEGFIAVVGDVDDRDVQPQKKVVQDAAEGFAGGLVQCGQRLVEQQQPRSGGERSSERGPLTFPAGQRSW